MQDSGFTPLYRCLVLLFALACACPLLALTDDEEAAKSGPKPPAEWVYPAHTPLHVLTVRGLWYQEYGIERALARLGGAVISEAWHSPQSVRYYPERYDELMRNHLIVVGNVNGGAFGPVRRKMLKDFVEHGGAVLFLGGKYAFGAQYHGNAFEELSPVSYADKDDLVGVPDGIPLALGPDAIGQEFAGLPWKAAPRVYWYHAVTPKPGAKVLLTAGGKPLLVTGTFGKGRVAVFAGSVMGDPQPGQMPLWEWEGWPAVVADTIKWLTEESGKANTALSADGKAQLKARYLGAGVKKAATLATELQRDAHCCGDRETADLLLRATANLEDDAPLELVDAVSHGTQPFADATLSEAADLLKNSGQTNKISLALRLYGKMPSAQTRALLEMALKTGDIDRGEEDDLLDPGAKVIEDPKDRAYAIRLGALEGLANLGDPAEAGLIGEFVAQYRKTRQDPAKYPKTITPEDELYQESLLAALHCGDAAAAAPAIDAILQNRYLFVTLTIILDQPLQDQDMAESYRLERSRVLRILERVRVRHAYLTAKLRNLPELVLPALAQRIAAEDDPRVIPLAFAIFGPALNGGRKVPAAVVETLKRSKLPAVAEMAR